MNLEIHVKDNISVFDKVGDAIAYIEEVVKSFMADDTQNTITINLVKSIPTRGPPALGVNVSESINTVDKGPGQR